MTGGRCGGAAGRCGPMRGSPPGAAAAGAGGLAGRCRAGCGSLHVARRQIMEVSPMTRTSEQSRLDQFYADVAGYDLKPLWPVAQELMPLEPKPRTVPWLWRWKTLRELAERSGELITIDRGGDRRVLSLANPGLDGAPYATSTLWGAVQYLNPGEHAAAHRHTPGAIRFVLEGDGVSTTVDGDACDMHPGDLVLTPSWNWHDHNSSSERSMIWFDGLDMPTVNALDAVFFEQYPDELLQPVRARNRSERRYPSKGLLPAGTSARPGREPGVHRPDHRPPGDGHHGLRDAPDPARRAHRGQPQGRLQRAGRLPGLRRQRDRRHPLPVGSRGHAGGAVVGRGGPPGHRAERPVRDHRRPGAQGARPVPRDHPRPAPGGHRFVPRVAARVTGPAPPGVTAGRLAATRRRRGARGRGS